VTDERGGTPPRNRIAHALAAPRCGAGRTATGPRTAEGLARSRMATWKHGRHSAEAVAAARLRGEARRMLAGLRALLRAAPPREGIVSAMPEEPAAPDGSGAIVDSCPIAYKGDMTTEPTLTVKKLVAMTPALAERIAAFRFERRIKTEAEAIRTLIERGLEAAKAQKPAPRRKA
jgi:hypothetical protein